MRTSTKRGHVGWAIALVAAVTLLDLLAAQTQTTRGSRRAGSDEDVEPRYYADRSGFPQGLEQARGAAARSRAAESTRIGRDDRADSMRGDVNPSRSGLT